MSKLSFARERGRAKETDPAKPTLKEKFAALRNLPRFFTLVWQTQFETPDLPSVNLKLFHY